MIIKVKKVLIVLLSFFLSTNVIAAVVSDNDGAAFVTKGEFDSLRNNFQFQINEYNTSIDSKISEAISAYLEGVTVNKRNYSTILVNNWDNVTFLRNAIAPQWTYPNMSFTMGGFLYSTSSSTNAKDINLNFRWEHNKTWEANETLLRPLVTTNGSEASFDKLYWNGVANRYNETINHTHFIKRFYTDLAYMDIKIEWGRLYTRNPISQAASGYMSNFETSTTYMSPIFYFEYKSSDSGSWNSAGTGTEQAANSTNAANVSLDAVDGETKRYKKVIMYDGSTTWTVSNENYTKTHRTHPTNTITAQQLWNQGTLTNNSWGITHVGSTHGANGNFGFSTQFPSNPYLTNTGLLGDYTSSNIKQFEGKMTASMDNKSSVLSDLSLSDGLPIHYVIKDTKIEWSFEFLNVKTKNGTADETNKREVDVYFSYGPFTNKTNTNSPAYVTKDKNGNAVNCVTTENRKGSINFNSAEDGVLFIKCVPHWLSLIHI